MRSSVLAAVSVLATTAQAHMTIWHPSMYGWMNWPDDTFAPMIDLPERDWWFRGYLHSAPNTGGELMELPAGKSISTIMACHFAWTPWGCCYEPSAYGNMDACPSSSDSGPWHADIEPPPPEPSYEGTSGCALAIADVDDANLVTRENLVVFSVNSHCVYHRDTTFDIPAAMPPCTGKKCVCAWFWLAHYGQANFYMTGFDCTVTGFQEMTKKIGAPQKPALDATWPQGASGPRQPFYMHNENPSVTKANNGDRVGYHSSYGWTHGAQNDIFTGDVVTANVTAPAAIVGDNIARLATITASSWTDSQLPQAVVDGNTQGWPVNSTSEWSSRGEKAGAWIKLTWPKSYLITGITLYDRPNQNEWVTSGTLQFSDGTTLAVGALANYGQASPINMPAPINTTSITFTVNSVGPNTWNVGLSEFAVFGRDSTAPPPQLAVSSSAVSSVRPTSTMASASSAFSSIQSSYVSASRASSSAAASSAAASLSRSSSAAAATSTVVPSGNNIAGLAKVAASTWYASSTAFSAIDGNFDGYPGNRTGEWTSVQKEGAWLRLTWPEDVIVTSVILYDRMNSDDRIMSGTLTFSDDTVVRVGPLALAGAATPIQMSPITTNRMVFQVSSVADSTRNAGLTEIVVIGTLASASSSSVVASSSVISSVAVQPTGSSSTPVANNIAGLARVAASTWYASSTAFGAIDGNFDGYPGNRTAEWASVQKEGAWYRMNWPEDVIITGVLLHDRMNPNDQITSASITFSDNSVVQVGPLNADGSATAVKMNPVTTDSLLFKVLGVSDGTANAGLAEIIVQGRLASAAPAPSSSTVVSSSSRAISSSTSAPMSTSSSIKAAASSSSISSSSSASSSSSSQKTSAVVTTSSSVKTSSSVSSSSTITSAPEETGTDSAWAQPPASTIYPNSGSQWSDIGLSATATASSAERDSPAKSAIDGKIDGYPRNEAAEWVTQGSGAGAWLKLTWSSPQIINSIALYDRPNLDDHIQGGTIKFSDGSSINVGQLDNTGKATNVNMNGQVTTTSLLFTITKVSSANVNIGLSEIVVMGAPAKASSSPVPTSTSSSSVRAAGAPTPAATTSSSSSAATVYSSSPVASPSPDAASSSPAAQSRNGAIAQRDLPAVNTSNQEAEHDVQERMLQGLLWHDSVLGERDVEDQSAFMDFVN